MTVLLYAGGNLCFVLCDLLLDRTAKYYRRRFLR